MSYRTKLGIAVWAGAILLGLFLASLIAGIASGWENHVATTIIAAAGVALFIIYTYQLVVTSEEHRINREAREAEKDALEKENYERGMATLRMPFDTGILSSDSFTLSSPETQIGTAHHILGEDGGVTRNPNVGGWHIGPPEYTYGHPEAEERFHIVREIDAAIAELRALRARLIQKGN